MHRMHPHASGCLATVNRLHAHTRWSPPPPLITDRRLAQYKMSTSIMTSGFTNPRDGCRTAMNCRLVVSVVHHSSMGLAER